MDESGQLSVEDVIPNRPSLLVFSRKGYIKRMPTDLFSVQAGPDGHDCIASSFASLPEPVIDPAVPSAAWPPDWMRLDPTR